MEYEYENVTEMSNGKNGEVFHHHTSKSTQPTNLLRNTTCDLEKCHNVVEIYEYFADGDEIVSWLFCIGNILVIFWLFFGDFILGCWSFKFFSNIRKKMSDSDSFFLLMDRSVISWVEKLLSNFFGRCLEDSERKMFLDCCCFKFNDGENRRNSETPPSVDEKYCSPSSWCAMCGECCQMGGSFGSISTGIFIIIILSLDGFFDLWKGVEHSPFRKWWGIFIMPAYLIFALFCGCMSFCACSFVCFCFGKVANGLKTGKWMIDCVVSRTILIPIVLVLHILVYTSFIAVCARFIIMTYKEKYLLELMESVEYKVSNHTRIFDDPHMTCSKFRSKSNEYNEFVTIDRLFFVFFCIVLSLNLLLKQAIEPFATVGTVFVFECYESCTLLLEFIFSSFAVILVFSNLFFDRKSLLLVGWEYGVYVVGGLLVISFILGLCTMLSLVIPTELFHADDEEEERDGYTNLGNERFPSIN